MTTQEITDPKQISDIETKAIKLFDAKFGKNKVTRFMKVREEFREMTGAFYEFLETGNDEHLRDEICDLQATVTHLASLFNLFQEEMLHTAMDKVIIRETDPEYKRFSKIGIIGGVGGAGKIDNRIELLKSYLENETKVLFIDEGSFEVVKCKDDIFNNIEKMKRIEMVFKAPMPLLNECKIETCFLPKEPKPWDRKEMNRYSKPSYKNKRRK